MPKRSKFDSYLVGLWNFAVLMGMLLVILELPAALSDFFGINLDTFTVKFALLVGLAWLYFRVDEIKQEDREREEFARRQYIKEQEQKNTKFAESLQKNYIFRRKSEMGLVKCADCGKNFSDRIDGCPNCGCPKDACSPVETHANNAQITPDPVPIPQKIHTKSPLPSTTKSFTIIGALLFVTFASLIHPYIENKLLYDYAMVFGLIETISLSLYMLVFPVFYVILVDNCTPTSIKRICIINSVATFLLSALLQAKDIPIELPIPFPMVGGLGAIAYYFINKHLLLQINAQLYSLQKRKLITIIICTCTALLLAIVLIGFNYASILIEKLT